MFPLISKGGAGALSEQSMSNMVKARSGFCVKVNG